MGEGTSPTPTTGATSGPHHSAAGDDDVAQTGHDLATWLGESGRQQQTQLARIVHLLGAKRSLALLRETRPRQRKGYVYLH
jgi:hypothetical protein